MIGEHGVVVGMSTHHRCAHCGNDWSKLYGDMCKRGGQGECEGMYMHHICAHCGKDRNKSWYRNHMEICGREGDKEKLWLRLCITDAAIVVTTGQKLA